jgi:hypothetical protein
MEPYSEFAMPKTAKQLLDELTEEQFNAAFPKKHLQKIRELSEELDDETKWAHHYMTVAVELRDKLEMAAKALEKIVNLDEQPWSHGKAIAKVALTKLYDQTNTTDADFTSILHNRKSDKNKKS